MKPLDLEIEVLSRLHQILDCWPLLSCPPQVFPDVADREAGVLGNVDALDDVAAMFAWWAAGVVLGVTDCLAHALSPCRKRTYGMEGACFTLTAKMPNSRPIAD